MAITSRDSLIAAVAAGSTIQFSKANVSIAAGAISTAFRMAGIPAASALAAPTTTGRTLDRTSSGAMPIPAPSGTSYIDSFEGTGATPVTLMLADRLVEFGGLSGTVTTAQSVSALALPARATGRTDVELWLEIYTAIGSSAASATALYTNQSGTSGRTATVGGGIPTTGGQLHRTYPFTLQSGDTGVQSVQSVTLGVTTGTAGNFGLVLRRSLLTGSIPSGGAGFQLGWAETSLQQAPDDACLEILHFHNVASTGPYMGNFGIAQG